MRVKQVIIVRRDLEMRKGKMSAQVAHASIAFLTRQLQQQIDDSEGIPRPAIARPYDTFEVKLSHAAQAWVDGQFVKIVLSVANEAELLAVYDEAIAHNLEAQLIVDSGLTVFNGVPTATCVAIGPDWGERLAPITDKLKLMN